MLFYYDIAILWYYYSILLLFWLYNFWDIHFLGCKAGDSQEEAEPGKLGGSGYSTGPGNGVLRILDWNLFACWCWIMLNHVGRTLWILAAFGSAWLTTLFLDPWPSLFSGDQCDSSEVDRMFLWVCRFPSGWNARKSAIWCRWSLDTSRPVVVAFTTTKLQAIGCGWYWNRLRSDMPKHI